MKTQYNIFFFFITYLLLENILHEFIYLPVVDHVICEEIIYVYNH